MINRDNSLFNTNFAFIGLILLCVVIGKVITVLPYVPILVVASVFIFLLAFVYMDFALVLLILAMLLSPEIVLGAASKQRSIVIRIDDLLIVVMSLAWMAKMTINKHSHLLTRTPINRFIGLYCLIFIITTLNGIITGRLSPLGATFYILKYIEYFLLFYLVLGVIKSKKQIKLYLKVFIIAFAIVNIYAFTQIGSGRVSAPFEGEIGEPNTLGGYQVLLLAVIIGLITHGPSAWWRWPLIGLSLFAFVPFAYTLSRASYMAIIPTYAILIICNRMRTRNMLIGVLIILIVLSIFFFPQNIKDRIAYTFIPEEQQDIEIAKIFGIELGPSASARLQDWKRLFKKWESKPFLGFGITGVGFVDSQYMRTLVELGMLGFAAFVALLTSIYLQVLKIYKTTKDNFLNGLALGFLAGHIGLVFHAITANTFILIRIMEPYWFLAAMVMMIPYLEESEKKDNEELNEEDENEIKKYKNGNNIENLVRFSKKTA